MRCDQLIQIDLVGMQFLQDVVSRWRLKNRWADSVPFHKLPEGTRLEFFNAAERLYYADGDAQ